ncbi:solute carrier family 22 member 3-like [Leguminivora glycinivorella]|uniref:solute carrier family 22 member 3-like n=1 Tax=Leguminivora glycinivorella TaxID=1035111 RepID=UPI0020100A95|nr:solute carrier family 22 member 3-like [Leguminivora glycinivorella]
MTFTCGTSNETGTCPCDNPVWDYSVFTKTVATKYGMICEKALYVSYSESILYFGLLIGAIVCGSLADRYGRLMLYATCQLIIGVAGCLVSFAPSFAIFCVMRFIEGFGSGGAIVTGFVLSVEYCGSSFRSSVSAFVHIAGNTGLIVMAGISYLLRDCDQFQLAISVPVMAFFFMKFILLESPKWLMDRNRTEEAVKVMEKFCRL